MAKELHMGGQAVIEGVLMRTLTEYAVAVRSPKGKIIAKKEKIATAAKKYGFFKLPFLRGILALYETLVIGFGALIYSSNVAAGEDERITKKEIVLAMLFSAAFAVAVFIVLPFFLASVVTSHNLLFNLVDGFLRLLLLLAYLVVISRFKDVQRIFQYHGAEHMTIHAYERKEKLTPESIKKFPTMHPRCGTSFLLIVVIVSIFVFSVITSDNFLVKFFSRILLVPVIAGVSYELLKLGGRFHGNLFFKPLVLPGIWLQYITTKRPDKSQIEVAVYALKKLVKQ